MSEAKFTSEFGHSTPFRKLHGPKASSDLCCVTDAQGAELATCADCTLATLFSAAPDLYAALDGLLSQLLGPVLVHGDGRGLDGTKTGLSGEEFNDLRERRIAAAIAALAKASGR